MGFLLTEEMVLDDIINTCKRYFGFKVLEAIPIKRGWLNLKWKITTDSSVFLIKQYNKERYKLYNHEKLLVAFSQQMQLHKKGFPCPKLYSYEGQFLFESDKGELFIVMEYCDGAVVPPGKLDIHQMHDLGRITGEMHHLLNDNTLRVKRSPEFIPPSRQERLTHWKSAWNHANDADKPYLLPILETQYRVTETINLEDFNLNETGWAHRDLWVDNLLFKEKKVSAFLDFDRLNYDYPQLDVARAVISGALHENDFDVSLVLAFIEGYSEKRICEKGFLISSLKMLWFMESTWWINSSMDHHSGPPERFAKEMIWLSENQKELKCMLGDL
ncbi:phosphotransferase [Sporosarcina sp. ANT_H38]|uniref:phosphotransferase n=1 Tax=Sporosarcina sp. ANT_H38 TaxID=2597358 RepID=UPI0011F2EF0A|nr:phosphotransferase [Sporosarcina sp. ANT_H38]KAA0940466.1 phosphotransferase [Sporosarcina sp. ANT_H38]